MIDPASEPRALAPLDERRRVLSLLRRHGWNATSFQVLGPGFRYWFDGDDACVPYAETGGAWVVAGAPVAPPARLGEVVHRFAEHARALGRRVCFFAAEARLLQAAPEGFFATLAVGEQPVWDPAAWEATVRGSKSLREQLRRARAKGVTVRALDAAEALDPGSPARVAIAALIARWLASRAMAPMGFLVDVQPFELPEERRHLVAEREGAVVGFLSAVPVFMRGGWFFEDLVRDANAPNGTAELLVDAAMRRAAAEGSRYVTLGLAPLAGDVGLGLRLARSWLRWLYDFRGLRAFKARLRPQSWEPIYVAGVARGPGGAVLAAALYDTLAAFARGSFLRFGLQTALRGTSVVARALAGALVPWTVLLALAAPSSWFPSPAARVAWTAFDVALIAGLLTLAARWRRWLGVVLAASITADSALTLAQVVAYNAPRARSPLDWAVLAAGWLAPTLAAVVLWATVVERERRAVA